MTSVNKSEKDRVIIFDTTLRDGEQCPGATMTFEEKLEVAELLDDPIMTQLWRSDRLDPENDEFPGCSDRDLAKESEENAKKPCDGLSHEACDAHPRCTWYDEDNGRIAYCTDL